MPLKKNRYKFKKGETCEIWVKALCEELNESTKGIKYHIQKWSINDPRLSSILYVPLIECHPIDSKTECQIKIKPKFASGDLVSVNVISEKIYRHLPELNRAFKVSKNGTVNIKKVHKCVLDRIKSTEEYRKNVIKIRDSRIAHIEHISKIIEGTEIKINFRTDDKNVFYLRHNEEIITGSLRENGTIKIRPTILCIPDEKIPAFFEAWHKLLEAIKDEDELT